MYIITKTRKYLYLLVLILTISTFSSESLLAKEVLSAEDAFKRARGFLGLVDTEFNRNSTKREINVVHLSDTTTPFHHEQLNTARVWKVSLSSVKFVFETKEKEIKYCDIDIYIDSSNGELLKIVLEIEKLDSVYEKELHYEEAERQLRLRKEEYLNLLSDPPTVGFIQAIGNSPFHAKKIVAHLVSYKILENATFPAWIVSLYGMKPFPIKGPPPLQGLPPSETPGPPIVTIDQRNHLRRIINANSGKTVMISNSPQVPFNFYAKDTLDVIRTDEK